jgi:uncharacterized membrane protein
MARNILLWLAGGILLFTWLMVARSYENLPPTIPIHFNAKGVADNWGPKGVIWVLPVLSSFLFGLFSLLRRYMHLFAKKSSSIGNPQLELAASRSMFAHLRLAVVLVVAVSTYYNIHSATSSSKVESGALVPFIILVMLSPVLLFLFRILRPEKTEKQNTTS